MDEIGAQGAAALDLVYRGADRVLTAVEGAVPSTVVREFFEPVNWREPFIVVIVMSHCILWTLAFFTRRNDALQFCLVAALSGATFGARRLNKAGREHWPLFASQNYFDTNGTFMLIFVLAPFVILANVIVVRDSIN